MGNFFGNLFYAFGLEKMLLKLLGRWLKGNGIKTTGSDYWAAYMADRKSKQTALRDRLVPMSLSINDLS